MRHSCWRRLKLYPFVPCQKVTKRSIFLGLFLSGCYSAGPGSAESSIIINISSVNVLLGGLHSRGLRQCVQIGWTKFDTKNQPSTEQRQKAS